MFQYSHKFRIQDHKTLLPLKMFLRTRNLPIPCEMFSMGTFNEDLKLKRTKLYLETRKQTYFICRTIFTAYKTSKKIPSLSHSRPKNEIWKWKMIFLFTITSKVPFCNLHNWWSLWKSNLKRWNILQLINIKFLI